MRCGDRRRATVSETTLAVSSSRTAGMTRNGRSCDSEIGPHRPDRMAGRVVQRPRQIAFNDMSHATHRRAQTDQRHASLSSPQYHRNRPRDRQTVLHYRAPAIERLEVLSPMFSRELVIRRNHPESIPHFLGKACAQKPSDAQTRSNFIWRWHAADQDPVTGSCWADRGPRRRIAPSWSRLCEPRWTTEASTKRVKAVSPCRCLSRNSVHLRAPGPR
jgi:hypothetical protein